MSLKIPLLDLSRQHAPLRQKIDAAMAAVIDRSGFILGPEVTAFENAFAKYCGVARGVGCSNGTDAIYLALKALGIGAGDEVITTPYTFMATVGAIERSGARPILVDILDDGTFTIDPAAIERAITPRTKAVIPIHLYGQAADMDAIMAIAAKRRIHVIEDCAQAHGATWKGKRIGGFGVISAFSFFPSKNLGCMGDSGICVTDDQALADKMTRIRVHGRGSKNESIEKGDNLRIDTLQCAILGVKLPHLDAWNASRRQVAGWYDGHFAGQADLILPKAGPGRDHVYHLYVLRSKNRDAIGARLDAAGIGWGLHYQYPVHLMKGFADLGYKQGDFPIAERMCEEIISIPIFPGMLKAEVDEVAGAVSG